LTVKGRTLKFLVLKPAFIMAEAGAKGIMIACYYSFSISGGVRGAPLIVSTGCANRRLPLLVQHLNGLRKNGALKCRVLVFQI
jgi:hypothetical protein